MRKVTPKSLVLDLLRVAEPRTIAVRNLVELAGLFGLTENSVRVAIARLAAAGTLESDERGSYRLTPQVAAVGRHVESWRLGERRVRRWNGAWLAIHMPRGVERAVRAKSRRPLELVGFRQPLDGIWLRPDNLAESKTATLDKLERLGLEAGAQPFVATDFAADQVATWSRSVFLVDRLVRGYRQAQERLDASLTRVEGLPLERAAVETFLVGGSAIRVLAIDPLLPRELLPSDERARLTEAMLAYDVIGRRIWKRLVIGHGFDEAPMHVHAIIAGSA
jgi:phenylacetic acid degradation operon negative regulatory protein